MSEEQSDQSNLIGRVKAVPGEVAGHPVVSASRERAQKATRVAKSQLPATREDVAKLQEQLDRVEQAVAALSEQLEAAKPRRRTTASAGSAKTES